MAAESSLASDSRWRLDIAWAQISSENTDPYNAHRNYILRHKELMRNALRHHKISKEFHGVHRLASSKQDCGHILRQPIGNTL